MNAVLNRLSQLNLARKSAPDLPDIKLGFWGILAITACLQFVMVSIYYPITELLSQVPLYYDNAAYHMYQMRFARKLAEMGGVVGYDPTFGAGYVGGVTHNGSAKLVAILNVVLYPWLDEVRLYKVYVFIADLITPLFAVVAARLFGLNNRAILVAAVLGLFLWWASWMRWIFSEGMVASAVNTYAGLCYLALLYRYLFNRGGTELLILLGVIGVGLFLYHPHYSVLVGAGTFFLLVFNYQFTTWHRVLLLGTIVPVMTLLPNLVWMAPMLRPGNLSVGAEWAYLSSVDISRLWTEAIGMYGRFGAFGAKIYPVILLGLVSALWFSKSGRERGFVMALGAAGFTILLFSYVGSAVPIFRWAEANRHAPAGYLVLSGPAAVGLVYLAHVAFNAVAGSVRSVARVGLVGAVLVVLFVIWEVGVEVSWTKRGHYGIPPPQIFTLSSDKPWLIDWIVKNTSNEGRILFESTNDGADSCLTAYISLFVDRQFVGGPLASKFFANFYDGKLLRRRIEQMNSVEIGQYFDLYNIGWVVAFTPQAKATFSSTPGLVLVGEEGQFRVYRVGRELNYFSGGTGKLVEASTNRLIFENVSGGDAGEVLLKFHYTPGLVSDPPLEIRPVKLMDDPNPFISVAAPPSRFRLFMK